MRIAIMLRTLDLPQGIGIYSRNLIGALLEHDRVNDYFLLYTTSAHIGTFGSFANVHEIIIPSISKFVWDQFSVPLFAQKNSIDIVFNTKFSVPLATRAKTIMVFHGSEWFVYPEFYGKLDIIYNKITQPFFCRKASAILSVSQFTREDMIRFIRFDASKCHVVHSAAHPKFKPFEDTKQLTECQIKYKLPDRYILFVGKLYPGKNFRNIIKAYALIKSRSPYPIKLVSVGDVRWKYDKDFAEVQRLRLEDDVLFTGWVEQEDMPALYQSAELFLFPSFYEGFGIPIVEAMACGCPVVTSKTGACPEVAGSAGVLVDPTKPDEIAEAVLRVLNNPHLRASLVQKGFAEAKRFSWDRSALKTIDVLNAISGTLH